MMVAINIKYRARIVLLGVLLVMFCASNAVAQCVGQTIDISMANYAGCFGNAATWDGAYGGQITNATSTTITVTFSNAGTFRLKRTFPCNSTVFYSSYYTVGSKPATPTTLEVNQQQGCGYVTLNYTGSGTGFWQTLAGGSDQSYQTTRQVTATGTYYLRVRNASGCWSDARSILVSSIPAAPVGGTLLNGTTGSHYGSVTRTLSLSGHSGTVKEWRYTENGGGENIVSSTSTSLTISLSGTTYKSRVYRAILQLNGCETSSSMASVTLSAVPAPSMTVCVGDVTSHSITNNIGTVGNAAEFALGSGGTINNSDAQSGFTVTWQSPGTYTLKRAFPYSDTERVGETVTVLAQPAAPLTSQLTQESGCGYAILSYSGSASVYWQTSPGGIDESYPIMREVNTSGTYYARTKANGCWSTATSKAANVLQQPVGGTLLNGTTGSHYGSVTRTLSLSGQSGTVKEWRYTENGGGENIVANTSTSLTVSLSGTTYRSRVYRAILQLNGCETSSSTASVTLSAVPSTSMTVCVGDVTSHSITSNIGTVGNAAEFALGSGGTVNNSDAQSGFTVLWQSPGTYTLKRVFPYSDTERAGETVLVLAQPTAPSASELTQQSGCGYAILSYSGSASVYWQTSPGGIDESYLTTRQVSASGTYYARTKSSNGCWSTATSKVATILTLPTFGTLTGGTTQARYGSITRDLVLGGPLDGAVKEWRYKVNGGTEQVDSRTSSAISISFTNTSTSNLTYTYWAIVQKNGCEVPSNPVNVTLTGIPSPNVTKCVGDTWTFGVTTGASCQGNAATFLLGESIEGGMNPSFNITFTSPGVYVVKRHFPCEDRDMIDASNIVQVLAQPAAPLASEVNQVSSCAYATLNYTGSVQSTFWQSTEGGRSEQYAITRQVTTSQTYYARVKGSNGCWSQPTPKAAVVLALPTFGTLTGGTVGTRYGSITRDLVLGGPIDGTVKEWRYQVNGGTEQIDNRTSSAISISFTNSGTASITRTYRAIVQKNGCEVASDPVSVTLTGIPSPNVTKCVGDTWTFGVTTATSCQGNEATFLLGEPIAGGANSSFNIIFNQPGIYVVKRHFPCPNGNDFDMIDLNNVVQVFENPVRAPGLPAIVSNCGNIHLGYAGTPSNGDQWHWQGQNQNGFLINSDATYVTNAPGSYYLRLRDVNGCWSNQTTYISLLPHHFEWLPSSPLVDYECLDVGDAIQLTSDNVDDRWFETSEATTPLSSSNVITRSRAAATIFIERETASGCVFRAPFEIDETFDVKCGRSLNLIKTIKPLDSAKVITSSLNVLETISYFDGLGRAIQQVAVKASPLEKDIITPVTYDRNGREAVKYLPYVSEYSDGRYNENALRVSGTYENSAHYQFYTSPNNEIARDAKPFAVTVFEPSPLNRVIKQGAPGEVWQPNNEINALDDKTVKKRYEFNGGDEVLEFIYNSTTREITLDATPADRFYAPGKLYASKTFDEHDNEVIEYANKDGKAICKKVQYDTQNGVKLYASTYYIYDDFENLVIVLSPEAVKEILAQLN